MGSLPICHFNFKSKKPNRKPYPKELKTIGDHIRKRRLDLNLYQSQVAEIINVETDTITNWEMNRYQPNLRFIPKIISFLGYSPIKEENPMKRYMIEKGISQNELAMIIGVDESIIIKAENKEGNISKTAINKLNSFFKHCSKPR